MIYPSQYDPRIPPIYAFNEIDVNAPAEVVCKLLTNASNWSAYCPLEDQVAIARHETELTLGTTFSQGTIDLRMSLVVTECVPERRLSWATTVDRDATGSTAFHGWITAAAAGKAEIMPS